MDQDSAPIFQALKQYAQYIDYRFHTPGHKGGKGAHPLLKELVGGTGLHLDLGLVADLDSLQEPSSWIARSQELAAELYSASESFFLVNGSTSGVHAMVTSVAATGDKIIVARNSHRSVAGAIILSGCTPVFVIPELDRDLRIPVGVTVDAVEDVISRHSDAKALFVTSPTYYGIASDLKAIVQLAHSHGIPVLVDEAHGPHLRFSDQLPISAMEAGADLCVQSTHKLLGSLSQCSILHSQGSLVDRDRIRSMQSILQSTSPSYLLLASLDIARLQMATHGRDLMARTIRLADRARDEIRGIDKLHCFGAEKVGSPGIFALDPTKLTVSTRNLKIPGREVERLLRVEHRIQAELFDDDNILLLVTIGDRKRDIDRLIKALRKISKQYIGTCASFTDNKVSIFPDQVEQVISPREAIFAKGRKIPFGSASGEISAEILAVYPPGIPLLWPGERVREEAITYCREAVAAGARLIGLSRAGEGMGTLNVVA